MAKSKTLKSIGPAATSGAPRDHGLAMGSAMLPLAFLDTPEAAAAAAEASQHALSLLTDLQLALAARAIAEFLDLHPQINAIGSDLDSNFDEDGGFRVFERRISTDFIDGFSIPTYWDPDDDDDDEPEPTRKQRALHDKAGQFFDALLSSYPLARDKLDGLSHSRESVAAMVPAAFNIRREALQIALATQDAPSSERAPRL